MFFKAKELGPPMVTEPLNLNDELLAKRVQRGDRMAFTQLVEKHSKRYFQTAFRFLNDQNEAEDMVQTAFLKFWQYPDKWDPNKNTKFTTWFYRIVVNLCLDHLKKKRPQIGLEKTPALPNKNPEESLDLGQRQNILERLLDELPLRQRAALNLCFYEGLSNLEAAKVLGIKLKALQSLLMRAKTTLKEKASLKMKGRTS